jgi:hypothetical protein
MTPKKKTAAKLMATRYRVPIAQFDVSVSDLFDSNLGRSSSDIDFRTERLMDGATVRDLH